MKNKSHNLPYFFLALLFSLIFWIIQRPLTDSLSNLFLQTNDSFVSVINHIGLYIIGTLLLSAALAWKLKSKREHSNSNSTVFLGVRIKRNLLFLISLLMILISLLNFNIFTATKIHSINILSSKPYSNISYSDISNINILASFDLYTRRAFTVFYCSLHTSFSVESKQHNFSGVIPFEKIDDLRNLIKANKIPYNVNYLNNCKDYSLPVDQRALIEDAFRVQLDL